MIVSTWFDYSTIFINLLMGMIFVLISVYLHYKTKNTLSIMCGVSLLKLHDSEDLLTCLNKFIVTEIIFNALSLMVSMILLSAVISRIFREGESVFG